MVKKLTAVGNSFGLVIEKPILELLKIDKNTELEVSTDGERLIIAPVSGTRKERLEKSIDKAMKKHANTLRKLAK